MPAPPSVVALVERFHDNREAYRSETYHETQLRLELLDPFFHALGWDVHNELGYAEAYKDVIHEDAIRVGGVVKAPDYCFRIGGTRKFFVEAKKPAVNIRQDPLPAFQLRRYAWSAKLPLSILTDFEELAVYDCRRKPAQTDKASDGRVLLVSYGEYLDRWDELAGLFSREAVLRGSFDKYAESQRGKRGTAEVDAEFLKDIESWREVLARNFALRNADLGTRELNFAVQRTIDRVIFLRICEDRGIEDYGRLQSQTNGPQVYRRLGELFRHADERYNSGLFHFHPERERVEPPDELTLDLALDDKPLRDIVGGLYYPISPYEFSVLPADILGQVYEQFLGRVIRLTAGHRAVVEEKPEVKKAGGVYYTPTYIVDYIVRQTVGKLLEGKTPAQAARLRVLDPACGSGSFLIGAYQFLLDWHLRWYAQHEPADHAKGRHPKLYQGPGGSWRLTTTERKRILLANIYGVDIDPQAVEVTKLSLLLKVLEGESQETLERQRRLFHERALPDLGQNIKCGNSLIGPDFYEGRQMSLLDEDQRLRINAFDWQAEFPMVFPSPPGRGPGEGAGGFDAVIGNPPWGQKAVADDEHVKQYIWQRYPSSRGIYDLFRAFVEQGVRLVRRWGLFGMVLPDIVLLKDYPETRKFLLEQLTIDAIDWWGMAFASAVIDAATLIGMRQPPANGHAVAVHVHDPEAPLSHAIPQADFSANPRSVFNLHLTPEKRAILHGLRDYPTVGDFFEVHEGVHSGNIRDELFVATRCDKSCRELYFGRGEIAPYHLRWDGRYIRLSALPQKKTRERYANAGQATWHEREKVLVRRTGDFVLAAVDREGRYASNNFFVVFPKQPCALTLHGLCALLNSAALTWYFRTVEPRRGRGFAELKIKHLATFPLPKRVMVPDACDALNRLGAERAAVAEKVSEASSPYVQTARRRTASHVDRQIDAEVCAQLGIPKEVLTDGSNIEQEPRDATSESGAEEAVLDR